MLVDGSLDGSWYLVRVVLKIYTCGSAHKRSKKRLTVWTHVLVNEGCVVRQKPYNTLLF